MMKRIPRDTFSFYLSKTLVRALKREAKRRKYSASQMVEIYLNSQLGVEEATADFMKIGGPDLRSWDERFADAVRNQNKVQ